MSASKRMLSIKEWSDIIANEVALLLDRKSRNCVVCDHFDQATQFCRLANQMPPPRVAVVGCEKFEEVIPF